MWSLSCTPVGKRFIQTDDEMQLVLGTEGWRTACGIWGAPYPCVWIWRTPPDPSLTLKLSNFHWWGRTTELLDHGWLCFTHPWTDSPPTPRQTPPRQTAHEFLGNLSLGKKIPSPE